MMFCAFVFTFDIAEILVILKITTKNFSKSATEAAGTSIALCLVRRPAA